LLGERGWQQMAREVFGEEHERGLQLAQVGADPRDDGLGRGAQRVEVGVVVVQAHQGPDDQVDGVPHDRLDHRRGGLAVDQPVGLVDVPGGLAERGRDLTGRLDP
jgi:hypothetical protein